MVDERKRRRRKDLCVLFIFISLCFRLKNSYVCASSLPIQVTYITGERDSTPRTIWFWVMLLFSSTLSWPRDQHSWVPFFFLFLSPTSFPLQLSLLFCLYSSSLFQPSVPVFFPRNATRFSFSSQFHFFTICIILDLCFSTYSLSPTFFTSLITNFALFTTSLSHTYVFKHIGPLRPFPSASCRDFQSRPQSCKYTFTRYGYANFIYTPFPPPVAAPMSTIPIQPSLWLRYFPIKPLNNPLVVKCHLVAVVPGCWHVYLICRVGTCVIWVVYMHIEVARSWGICGAATTQRTTFCSLIKSV